MGIMQALKDRPLWTLDPSTDKISRSFIAKNFAEALGFLNAVGEIAEREGVSRKHFYLSFVLANSCEISKLTIKSLDSTSQHHPDLHLTSYR